MNIILYSRKLKSNLCAILKNTFRTSIINNNKLSINNNIYKFGCYDYSVRAHGQIKIKRFRKKVYSDNTQDLSKGHYTNKQIKQREEVYKNEYLNNNIDADNYYSKKKTFKSNKKINTPISNIVEENQDTKLKKLSYLAKSSQSTLSKIKFNPYIKANPLQTHRLVKNTTNMALGYIKKSHKPNWSEMFSLDHNAQSLENLRRFKENSIFFRKLKFLHEKKLGTKNESRKLNNILDNYGNFHNYESYNNTLGVDNKSKIEGIEGKLNFSLLDFMPDGSTEIGKSYNDKNPFYNYKLNILSNDNLESFKNNKYQNYLSNTKEFENLRIQNVVSNKFKNNPRLEKLMNSIESKSDVQYLEDNSIKTNSSLDYINQNDNIQNSNNKDISIVANKLDNKNHDIDIINDNNTTTPYIIDQSEIINKLNLSIQMKDYELEAYKNYRNLDIYDKYKSKRICFSDLTLKDMLNYIKFNVNSSTEIFSIFNDLLSQSKESQASKAISLIKSSSFSYINKNNNSIFIKNKNNIDIPEINPYIIASMIQKLSMSITPDTNFNKIKQNLLQVYSYKQLLSSFKDNIKNLNLKNIVDTLYAISKLHKENRTYSYLFFQNILNDSFIEITLRFNTILNAIKNKKTSIEYLEELLPGSISYLCLLLNNFNILHTKNEIFVYKTYYNLIESLISIVEYVCTGKIKSNYFNIKMNNNQINKNNFDFNEISNLIKHLYTNTFELAKYTSNHDIKSENSSNNIKMNSINVDRLFNLLDLIKDNIYLYTDLNSNELYPDIEIDEIINILSGYSHAIFTLKQNNKNIVNDMIMLKNDSLSYSTNITIVDKQDETRFNNLINSFQQTIQKLTRPILIKLSNTNIHYNPEYNKDHLNYVTSLSNYSIRDNATNDITISQASKMLYYFTLSDVYVDEIFQKTNLKLKDKLEAIEEYTIKDISYFTLGMSKFYMREIFPDHNLDVFNIIYPICSSVRRSHSRFNTFEIFTNFGPVIHSLDKDNYNTNVVNNRKKNVKSFKSYNVRKYRNRLKDYRTKYKTYINYYKLKKVKGSKDNKFYNRNLLRSDKYLKEFKHPNKQNLYLNLFKEKDNKIDNKGVEPNSIYDIYSVNYNPDLDYNKMENVCLIIYSMALMGYKNNSFYNSVFEALIIKYASSVNKKNKEIEYNNIGYIFQTLALLNNNYSKYNQFYVNYFIDHFKEIIIFNYNNCEFIVSQVLSSSVNLNTVKYYIKNNNFLTFYTDIKSFIYSRINSKLNINYNKNFDNISSNLVELKNNNKYNDSLHSNSLIICLLSFNNCINYINNSNITKNNKNLSDNIKYIEDSTKMLDFKEKKDSETHLKLAYSKNKPNRDIKQINNNNNNTVFDAKRLLPYIDYNLLSKYQKGVLFLILCDLSINKYFAIENNTLNNNHITELIMNFYIDNKIIELNNITNNAEHLALHINNLWENYFINIENDKYLAQDHNAAENSLGLPLYKIFINILEKLNNEITIVINDKTNENLYEEITVKFKTNYVVYDSFIIPIYIPDLDLAILFYDESELLHSQDIKGFEKLRENIISTKIKNIERVNDTIDIRKINESKYFEIIKELVKYNILKDM